MHQLHLLFVLLMMLLIVFLTNQTKASCFWDIDANPRFEFYSNSSCQQRRGGVVATVPHINDQVDFDRKCVSLANVAKRVDFTIPPRMNVWTFWRCQHYWGCRGGRNGGVFIYKNPGCTGTKKYIKLGTDGRESHAHCIDRPGGGYIILRCREEFEK